FVAPLLLSNHCTDCVCFFSLDDSLDMSTTLSCVSGITAAPTCLPQAQLHFLRLVMIAAPLFSHSHFHLAVWRVDSHFHWLSCISLPTCMPIGSHLFSLIATAPLRLRSIISLDFQGLTSLPPSVLAPFPCPTTPLCSVDRSFLIWSYHGITGIYR